MRNYRIASIFLALFSVCIQAGTEAPVGNKPNILLIMVDDMGWTDVGAFGSEISTPNIDALSRRGTLFTDFHVSVSCSPTRSMLLSGTDNHLAGLGNMGEMLAPNQKGKPGYEGHLNKRVVSLAENLREGGYNTYMAGKWHLGHDRGSYPHDRGFDESFSMLFGGASYWSDMFGMLAVHEEVADYVHNDKKLNSLPDDFYATRSFADFLMQSIRDGRGTGKPFFAYMAFTAPHDPLHVPEPWLSLYEGSYDEGYQVLKSKRAKAARDMGLVAKDAPEPSKHPMLPDWESLDDAAKAQQSRGMEVYAGIVSNMDYHTGRILHFLDDIGELDNTIVLFLSDNGPNPWSSEDYPGNEGSEWFSQFDNSSGNIGHPMSHYAYGIGWGSASAGPLDLFKMTVGEGGIRSPLIIAGPGIKTGAQSSAFTYVWDIMPTLLDFAAVDHPERYMDRKPEPLRGKSLRPVLAGKAETVYGKKAYVGGEMQNGKWMRHGDYKAVTVAPPYGDGEWRLFNVVKDPGETNNLAVENPELLAELQQAWGEYAEEVGVILIE
ncbi:MAG: arylsulfatase [Halieaceae bacterium]